MKRIYIEITNRCILSCSFCPKTKREKRNMSTEEFSTILKETSTLTPFIYLHVQGEPLLHPQFDKFLEIADTYHQHIQLVTNGTLLSNHKHLYKHPSIRKISFSLQSIEFQSKENLSSYMEQLVSFVKEAHQVRDDLYIEYRFWREDQLLSPNTKYAYDRLKNEYSFEPTNRKNSYQLDKNTFLSYANSFEWPSIESGNESMIGSCLGTIQQIGILVDGTVVPCCLDYDGSIPLGNIFQSNLSDILQSERFQAIKNGFQNNQAVEELCRHCTYKDRFIKEELK